MSPGYDIANEEAARDLFDEVQRDLDANSEAAPASPRKLDCWGCNIAAVNPRSGSFQSDCTECQARSLATSPHYQDSLRLGYLTHAYQRAIWDVFGTSIPVAEAHAKVKAWAEKIRPLRPVL